MSPTVINLSIQNPTPDTIQALVKFMADHQGKPGASEEPLTTLFDMMDASDIADNSNTR